MGGESGFSESLQSEKLMTARAVNDIYRPLLRYYFACFTIYYALMLPTHLALLSGWGRFALGSAAATAAAMGLFGFLRVVQTTSDRRVEALMLGFNLVITFNVVIALKIEFDSVKLVYFVIISMAFALASASLRQAVASIAVALLALVSFLPVLDMGTFTIFAFVCVAATIAALSIATLLRRAITIIAHARLQAEAQLTDAHALEQTLREQSLSDSLTGLPNRRAFFNFVDGLAAAQSSGSASTSDAETTWLLFIDLDGFKAVNDVHGHPIGDALLQRVAKRLSDFAEPGVHVCRMGGDEFNLIMVGQRDEAAVESWCASLLAALAEPYFIADRLVRISGSAGCRRLDPACGIEVQMMQADFALMLAKRQGKNRVVRFAPEHAVLVEERRLVERALRDGDLHRELKLVFQPQVAIDESRILAAEVLARWVSPTAGEVEPEHFIRIAEESGLITGITLTIVEKAFVELKSWPVPIRLSINLSGYDLVVETAIDQIIALQAKHEIDPSLIEFEVTETAMMADFDKALANLEKLTAAGFTIALDDFGTGYSNFISLKSMPISKLKLDRSFIQDPADPMAEKILQSLAGMARALGVHCLLEGVEDELSLLVAKRVGAQSVQGYLFGRPMSGSDLVAMVQRHSFVGEGLVARRAAG
jgi:diguanylate cyclase (GGDEF)-like protein